MSNKEKVLNWLRREGKITGREATLFLNLNGGTFTKLISTMIKEGYNIRKETVYTENKSGERKHFTLYSLEAEE